MAQNVSIVTMLATHIKSLWLRTDLSDRQCREPDWPSSPSPKPWHTSQPPRSGQSCSSSCWWTWDWAACSAPSKASSHPSWILLKCARSILQVRGAGGAIRNDVITLQYRLDPCVCCCGLYSIRLGSNWKQSQQDQCYCKCVGAVLYYRKMVKLINIFTLLRARCGHYTCIIFC